METPLFPSDMELPFSFPGHRTASRIGDAFRFHLFFHMKNQFQARVKAGPGASP
jgi:hypothetical protein